MRLDGRNMVVVGVGPGLGIATAYLLLNEGANVAVVARSAEHLEEIRSKLPETDKLFCITADASNLEGAKKIARVAGEKFGAIDALALLAGNFAKTPVDSLASEAMDSMLNANLKAPLYVLSSMLRFLKSGSSVVMVSSVFGTYKVSAGNVVYSAAKAGIAKATESLADELAVKGIRVNAVAPNAMSHDFEPGRDWRLKRKLGDPICPPEDVANVVVWLMTDDAGWVSGAVIPVDGGAKK